MVFSKRSSSRDYAGYIFLFMQALASNRRFTIESPNLAAFRIFGWPCFNALTEIRKLVPGRRLTPVLLPPMPRLPSTKSEINFQSNFRLGGYFNSIPYFNVQQGLKTREMNQLPTLIDSHTPAYLSELHNVHLTPIYESYQQTTSGVLPTQRRFGVHA